MKKNNIIYGKIGIVRGDKNFIIKDREKEIINGCIDELRKVFLANF